MTSESIMLINTMQINRGQLAEFRASVERAVAFVEANAPQLMVNVYVDEANLCAYSFQYYPDSEAIQTHWQLSDPHIQDVSKYITVKRLDVYGNPSDAVVAGITAFGEGSGVEVTVTPHMTGFDRFEDRE